MSYITNFLGKNNYIKIIELVYNVIWIKCHFLVISINVKIIFYYHSLNINKYILKNDINFKSS